MNTLRAFFDWLDHSPTFFGFFLGVWVAAIVITWLLGWQERRRQRTARAVPFAEHLRRMDSAVWAAKCRLAQDQRAFPADGHSQLAATLLAEAGLHPEIPD